ncbi:MAG: hypothetical protein ACJ77Z_01330, partial [Thermoleophilaceae bacterium]
KSGKRKAHLDPTQAHMNHVHIELNKLGAAMRTTFWNKSVRYPVQEPAQTAPPQPQDPRYGNGGSGWNGGGNWNGGGGQYGGSPPR